MAKPIKDTPLVTGRDAEKFNRNMAASMNAIADPKVKERIKQNFQKLQSIAKF